MTDTTPSDLVRRLIGPGRVYRTTDVKVVLLERAFFAVLLVLRGHGLQGGFIRSSLRTT